MLNPASIPIAVVVWFGILTITAFKTQLPDVVCIALAFIGFLCVIIGLPA